MKKFIFAVVIASAALFSPLPAFADEATVLLKVQESIDKQDRILAKLDAIQEELRIVKIRSTLNS